MAKREQKPPTQPDTGLPPPERTPAPANEASASGAASRVRARRAQRYGRWAARLVLLVVCLLGILLSALPVGRAVTRAAVLLPAFLSATEPLPLQLAGEPIRHTQITLAASNGPVYIDIYAPTAAPPPIPGARQALVTIPGVGDNRTSAQLINFSESLARAGIVVVNLTTPTLINFDLASADTDAVVQAFAFATRLPGVGADRVGLLGFSGGGVLACLAAADPRIRDQVAFVALFGGVFDVSDVIRDVGRRAMLVDGHLQPFRPEQVPIQVMANVLARTLPPDEGRILVGALAPGGTPLSHPEQVLRSPGAAAAYHLLAGDDPAHVEAHLAALSPAMRALLSELSPSRVIGQIRAPVYLLHDRNDSYIPFTQSRDFDAALTRLGHPHDFAEFGVFRHTEVTTGAGVGPLIADGSTLARILTRVLVVGA